MNYEKMIAKLADKAREAVPMDDTYLDDEGFRVCKMCGTRREKFIEVPNLGIARKVSHLCKCQDEANKKEQAQFEKKERLRRIEMLRRSGFPDSELRKCTFENDKGTQPKIMEAVKKYVENFEEFKKDGKGLLFYGNVGTGKTFIAACIANALVDKGIPAMVTNFARIANKLQESFDGRQAYLDSLNQFDLLVIDDLAAERKTEFMQEIVFNVIDSRYRSGKPMIITTNLSAEAFKNPASETETRIFDRIMERCLPIEVKGKSHRKNNAIEQYGDMKDKLGLN